MNAISENLILGQFDGETDIGSVRHPGSCEYDAEEQAYIISGSGADIWRNHDDFHFVWKRIKGDFILTTWTEFLGVGANRFRKIGWMARAGLSANSPHVSAVAHGDGSVALQFRRKPGGPTEQVRSPVTAANVLQLERRGNNFIMSVAQYGNPFTAAQVADIDLGDDVYAGLFVCSHETEGIEQAIFQDVRIVVPVKESFDREKDAFGSRLEILNLASGNRRVIYAADKFFEAPNWTRDGQALIYNTNGRLVRHDLDSGQRKLINTGDKVLNNNDHVLSFDGSMLALSSHDPDDGLSRVYTVPLQGGQPRLVTPRGPSYLHGWSPDGKWLVYCAERNSRYDVYRIPVEGGEEIQLTNTPGLDDGPEYTPDGKTIYFNSVRSGSMQIWRMKADGTEPEQMTADEYNNWFPHVSPDGQWVVFVSYLPGEVEPGDHPPAKRVYLRLVPLDGGTPRVVAYLYGGQGTMNVPSWSPDGKQLAFVSNTVPYK
jgi:TolB protein